MSFKEIIDKVCYHFGGKFEDGVLTFEDLQACCPPDIRPHYSIKIEIVVITNIWYPPLVAVDGVVLLGSADHIIRYINLTYIY
jgi:hypothetical protein